MKRFENLGVLALVIAISACSGLNQSVPVQDTVTPVGQALEQAEAANDLVNPGQDDPATPGLAGADVGQAPGTPSGGGATPIAELGATAETSGVTTAQVLINNQPYWIDLAPGWEANAGLVQTADPSQQVVLYFTSVLPSDATADLRTQIQSVAGQSAVIQEQQSGDITIFAADAANTRTFYVQVNDQLIAVSPLASETAAAEAQEANILTMIESLRTA
ncbi:MAG: hypothetical protein SF162_14620 [bacterium]|nr:hypothetical protein [bacterium]